MKNISYCGNYLILKSTSCWNWGCVAWLQVAVSDFLWNYLKSRLALWDEPANTAKPCLANFCALFTVIPCKPPPKIANGNYEERANYVYQSSVTYRCQDPFSLIGTDTIYCTSDAQFNGVWSGPPPECKGCWDFSFFITVCIPFFGSRVGRMDFPSRKEETNPLVQSSVQFQWRSRQHGGYWLIMTQNMTEI